MKEGWEYKKLGEITTQISDGSHNPPKGIESSNYPMLSSKNIFFDKFDYDSPRYLSKEDFETENKRTNISDGDVLLTIVGTVGRTCCVQTPFTPFTLQRSVAVLKPKKDIVKARFLMYFLHSLSDFWEIEANGVAQKGVYLKQVGKIPIPIPSLSEQQHIVEELDLLSSIIEKKKAQLKELDNLAQSLFYEMFGDNADCSTKKIKDIAIVKIGPFGSSLHKSDYVSGGTPLINPIHMSEGKILPDENFTITNEKKKELETYLLQTNDIIFGRRGDIGRCALVTRKENGYLCGTGSLFVRFQVNINPIYCINYLSTRFVKDYLVQNAKGATMLNLNSKIIENVPMLFPSLDLQNQFASKIEAIEHQKELIKQSIKEVETLFNSRMDYYFN